MECDKFLSTEAYGTATLIFYIFIGDIMGQNFNYKLDINLE